MNDKPLEIKQTIQIQKPESEVFNAITDPHEMSHYFIEEASGPIEEGKEVMWKFPEFDERFTILGHKIEQDKYISFYWDLDKGKMLVEVTLDKAGEESTIVTVTEKGKKNDDEGIKWLAGNSGGWANFLACLKAYLEYGINLRKGAFDFMKKIK